MRKTMKQIVSLLLVSVMVFAMLPLSALAALSPSDAAVAVLTQMYDGDEKRARSDLEALYASGLVDADGKMVELDVKEDGKSVDLSDLANRINNGEKTGDITVNGSASSAEQITQLSQMETALEIASLLDEEINATDEHADNLQALLEGIADGSIDLSSAIRDGSLSLTKGSTQTRGLDEEPEVDLTLPENTPAALTISEDGKSYIAPYISGSTYIKNYPFELRYPDAEDKANYTVGYTGANPQANSATTENNARVDSFDWEKAVIGVDSYSAEPTVTVILPFKTDDSVQNWIASDFDAGKFADVSQNGLGVQMDLPGYGTANLKYYYKYMYFEYTDPQPSTSGYFENPSIRFPVYLVEDTSTGRYTAVATRFVAPANTGDHPRLDTLSLHVDRSGNTIGPTKIEWTTVNHITYVETNHSEYFPYLPDWSEKSTDAGGNYYWNMKECAIRKKGTDNMEYWNEYAPAIPGRGLRYYIPSTLNITSDQYKIRPEGSWEQAKSGFIKLTNPENPEFPYVYPGNVNYPERQYDIELMVTKELYEAFAKSESRTNNRVFVSCLSDELGFVNDADYPWVIEGNNWETYAKCGNARVNSTSSALTLKITLEQDATVSFDYCCETDEFTGDCATFSVDYSTKFSESPEYMQWTNYSCELSAGTHTLTWNYSKDWDDRFDAIDDGFKIKNFSIRTEGEITQPEDNTTYLLAKLYEGDDFNRVALRVSDRRNFSRGADGSAIKSVKWIPSGPNYIAQDTSADGLYTATLIPARVTPAENVFANINKLGYTLTPSVGSQFTKYVPVYLTVCDAKPFLMVPESSRIRKAVAGLDTDMMFASNLAKYNKIKGGTVYNVQLYKIGEIDENDLDTLPADAQPVNVPDWGRFAASASSALTHITIPGSALDSAGAYAMVITSEFSDGIDKTTFSVIAYLNVKNAPAKITLGQLSSTFVSKDHIPAITYTLVNGAESTEVKYTVQGTGENVSGMIDAAGGAIDFTPDDFEGLKKAYVITVYARNNENDPWSVDSLLLTVYNNDILELLVKDVALGEVGGSTGGNAGNGVESVGGGTINMDNSSKIEELLDNSGEGAGYQISGYDFDTLRADVGLQRVISANYGSGVWGTISDRMRWTYKESDGRTSNSVTLNNKENGFYADLRNYSYTSYIPTTDFLIVATDDRSESAPVTITATHALTGTTKSVNVTVNTLKDKLYLFRFLPKATTYVYYTNGKGDVRELHTNEKGELIVYEPYGIASDVVTMSQSAGETYVGTIQNKSLVSGEKNIAKLELYPCNNLNLVPLSNQTVTFLKPDGTPYSGAVTLRAGIYKAGEYCPEYGVRITKDDEAQILRTDIALTAEDGVITLYYDPTQLMADNGLNRGLRYVYEYRIDGYQPGYTVINPLSKDPAAFTVYLQAVRGNASAPQITRQEYQQYLNGTKPTSYKRNVIDSVDNIGISPNYPLAKLYTDIALPNETVGTDAKGYSTYEGENVVKVALYTANGTKLHGQTDLSSDSANATQITNLSRLDDATYFVFPFSAVPMLRSTYTMTDADMREDGIDDIAKTPTARIKAVFTRGDLTVKTLNMPFGVTNVSNQPDLTSSTEGAAAVGSEVRDNLRETTDIGSIFRSINVNDMIRKGFVFLGNLTGEGGDNPINLMILPTQDPATFRVVAFVGANQRGGDDDGVSVNFNADDLAEDINKFQKEFEGDGDEEDSGGEGSMTFNFYGTIILDVHAGVKDGKWSIAFRGGNVGANVKGKYEWGQTFMAGPVPVFISFEVGFHADLEVAFGNKSAARAMLLDAALGVSIEAFAGIGFDLSLVALQLGIYGKIGADVDFLLLTPSNESAKTGTKLTISGEIGIKFKVKVLFVSYTKTFASTGFNWTKKWNNYDKIKQYWNNQGYAQLFGKTAKGRAYSMYLFADGSTMVAIDEEAELETRDYLDLAERAWNGGVNRGRNASAITDIQTNAYPYSHPAFTDDGELFLYISDNNNSEKAEGVTSYAVRNGAGYDDMGRVDTSDDNILSDLDVVASGTKNNAFAAWVKQIEAPRMDRNAEATNDDLGMMFNATEVYAGTYNGTAWTTARLTDNNVADMAPTVASCGDRAIVAWRSMSASSMTANADITAVFNVENNINYRIYDGSDWTDAQIAYNGSAGTVNAIDSAMLSDGTAILTYTVRTGNDVSTTETFYTVIGSDGKAVTTGRLTNDNYTDTNAQATAVNDLEGGYFVLGWYSEHDAGEGTTSEYDENENAAQKAVVAHDIRLARINANGSYDVMFPESIGGSSSSSITSDFRFSAPANNTDIENLSIVWSQRTDSDEAADAGKYELNAVRFFDCSGILGVTAPTDIAQTAKNYTIDFFDVFTDNSGAVNAVILGSDYSSIEGISYYDSIDLDAAVNNTVADNSDSPNNLQILDGEAISSLKLAKGTFPELSAKVSTAVKITEVIPGLTVPVHFNVTNNGTGILETITASVGSQSKDFTVNLLPNQSKALILNYSVPEGAVSDPEYSVTSSGTVLDSGTLNLNRPDVSIAGMKILREENGERDIQVRLSNNYGIPFEGSGKTVKLALYKDPFYTNQIDEVTINSEDDLAGIDAGTYRTVRTVDVTELFDGDEIPDAGLTVYAKAWAADTDEPNVYNNTSFISFTGLLSRNDGRKFVEDSMLEVNGDGSYTVYTDIRNNSLQPTTVAVPVAVLLDSEGNIIAQKNLQDTELQLGGEQRRDDLVAVFAANEVEGTAVAAGIRHISRISFDVNGGEGEFASVLTDLDGHIVIPAGEPTAPESEPAVFFRGWYTSADGGEKVTADYVFTDNCTIYARYTTHEHEFSYSAEGDTVTATCVSTVNDICPLEDRDRKATLTIVAPERATRNVGSPYATITGDTELLGTPEILYYAADDTGNKTGDALTEVPLAIGRYWAEFTLGEGANSATAHVVYELTVEGSSSGQSSGTKVAMRDFVRVTDSETVARMGYYDPNWYATAGDALYWIFSNTDLLNADTGMKKLVIFKADNGRFNCFSFYEVGQDRMLFGEDVDVGDVAYNDIPYGYSDVYFPTFDSNEIKAASFTETTDADALYAALAAMPDGTDLDAASWMAANEDKLSEGRCLVVFSNSQDGYRFYSCNNSNNIVGPLSMTSFDGVFDQIGKVYVINEVGTTGGQVDINQQFTLNYNANGGIGTLPEGGNLYYKSTVTVADGKDLYTNVGLVFDGWNTKADGTGDAYAPKDTFYIERNTTLYAQWKHAHTWSYSYDENTGILTATCSSTCDLGVLTLQPDAVDKLYDGKNAMPFTCSDEWTEKNGLTFPEVTYYKDGVEVAEAKNVGTYTAVVTIDGHEIDVGEFTVNPRPVAIIADDQTMYYGDEEPELTVSYDQAGTRLRFENDATYAWQVVNEDDRTYAKSGNAGAADSTSTLTLKVTLAEDGTLTFDYKYGSERNCDYCYFRIDGSEKLNVTGDGNTWKTFSCALSAGEHTLTWAYSKDYSGDRNGDFYAIDNVRIFKGKEDKSQSIKALSDSLRFTNDTSYPWQMITEDGRSYAIAGNSGQGKTTSTLTLEVTLEEAGTLSFDYKYGSEDSFDLCYFSLDGGDVIKVSGVGNWQTYSCDLSAGSHTLVWTYTKDGSGNDNGDFYAIDNVVITTAGAVTQGSSIQEIAVTQPESGEEQDVTVSMESLNDSLRFKNDASYPWQEVTEGDRVYAKSGNAGHDNTTSTLTLLVTLEEAGSLSFDYRYGSENGCDVCRFKVDGNEKFNVSGYGDWQSYSCDLSAGTHTFTWSYTKDSSSESNGDFFAVDNLVITSEGAISQIDIAELLIQALNKLEGGIVEGETLNYTISHEEITGEGTYTITVTPGENPNYDVREARNGTLTVIEIQGEKQTITVEDVTAAYGDTGLKIHASTDGDGTLSYNVKSGDAVTVDSEGNITIVKAGTAVITVTASQTDTYAPTSKSVTVTVNKADPTYTVPTRLQATYGTKLSSVTLPAGWSWADGTQSVGNAGTNTFKATFTPTDTTNYNVIENVDVTVTVNKADPTYTVPSGLTAIYGDTLGDITLPEGWSWASGAQTVGNAGTNTFKVNFTPSDTNNYNVISNVDVTVTVSKADQATPDAPEALTVTTDSITLNAVTNGEYKCGDGEWQSSPVFTGLEKNTEYTFYQRLKADANHNASEIASAVIKTSDHNHDFTFSSSGDTITATCTADGCPLDDGTEQHNHTATLTVVAPALTAYGGNGDRHATLTSDQANYVAFKNLTGTSFSDEDIKYVGRDGTTFAESATAPTDAGKYSAKITVGGVTATVDYEIAKADPTYTVPTGLTATYGDTLSSVTLPSGWSWADGTQTVGNAGSNTFKAAFTLSDTNNYNIVSDVDVSVTVNKANPTYTVPTGLEATYGDTLSGVTLPDGWAWADGTQNVGNAGANTFKAKFTPADTNNYNIVNNVDVSVTVNKANPTYTVPTGLTATYGDTLSSVTLPDGWAWADGTQTVGNAGSNTFKATFTPDDTDNYNVIENIDVNVTVGKADPSCTVPTGLEATYGDTLADVTLPEGWAWADDTQTVGNVGSNTFKATFTPADTSNYNVIENVDVNVTVGKVDPSYTVPTDLTATYGDTLSSVTLPEGWAWADGTQTVGNAGSNTFKATFTPADTSNYNVIENIDVTVTVGKADPEYTVPAGLEATYGDTLADVTLPEGWSWADDTQTVGNAGSNTFKATFTPADTNNYNTVEDVDVTVAVNKAEAASAAVTANELVWDGTAKALVTVTGEAVGGEMQYAVGADAETAPEDGWSTEIPTGTEPDTYFVWYRVASDDNHNDTAPACVEVTIAPVYTIKFVDHDGTVISEATYLYGETVTVPADPTREEDEDYTYTFKGWDKTVTAVEGDETYTAEYDSTEKPKFLPGDINGDGEVDNKDVVALFRYVSGYDDSVNEIALDTNGDGEADNKDVVFLFRYFSGHDIKLSEKPYIPSQKLAMIAVIPQRSKAN